MAVNLASKYAKKVSERFYRESQIAPATNNEYRFNGVKTISVYSIKTVPTKAYTRSGLARYGTPTDLEDEIQTLTITQDKAFTFIIDRGDKVQRLMIEDAGKALSREIREVVVPEIDTYAFNALKTNAGNSASTAVTKSNAYELLLNAQEALGNAYVPDSGRVCFCSYKFANFLKLDPSFTKDSDVAQRKLIAGQIGEIDGCRIVKVPASRLPSGCSFILIHPSVLVLPRQLTDYKIHSNPPGISGWLVEGRFIYDCFVLNNKKVAIFYHGSASST